MKQTWIAVMVVVVAGCSSPAKKSSNEPAGGGASGAGSGSATSQVTKAARGAACVRRGEALRFVARAVDGGAALAGEDVRVIVRQSP